MIISISTVLLNVTKVIFFILFIAFWAFRCLSTNIPRSLRTRVDDLKAYMLFISGVVFVAVTLIYLY